MTLLALARPPLSASTTTQSSLHQPGLLAAARPSRAGPVSPSRSTTIPPAKTSSGRQQIGAPFLCSVAVAHAVERLELHFASMNWYVGPLARSIALSRMTSARIWQASERVAALMLSRWKKSPSPGNVWILDCADDPDRARAPSTTPSGPFSSTMLADLAEAGELRGAEVQHAHAVAEDAALDGDVRSRCRRVVRRGPAVIASSQRWVSDSSSSMLKRWADSCRRATASSGVVVMP